MRVILSCLLIVWPLAAWAQQQRLSLERLYSLPWIIGSQPKEFVWSSDSRRLAFLWNDKGTNFYDVWTVDVRDGKPVRVTSISRDVAPAEMDAGVSSVLWRDSGHQLLFTVKGQLYSVTPGNQPEKLVDVSGVSDVKCSPAGDQIGFIAAGELWIATPSGKKFSARRVTAISRKDVGVEDFFWSPDGGKLAFIEDDETHMPVRGIPDYLDVETKLVPVKRPFPGEPSEYRRVGIIRAQGNGAVRWADLSATPLDLIFGVTWAPDSKTILVDKSDLYVKDRRLLLVNPQTGNSSLLLREADPKNVTAEWWADWAPDSRGVYFISDRDNDYHIYYKALNAGEPKRITSGDWAVFSATVSAGGKAIFFSSNEGKREERHLFKIGLQGGVPQRMTASAGTHTATVSPDGRFAADYFSNDLTPPDLYLQRLDGDESALQVTHSPLPEFTEYKWVSAQYVTFPNVHDGSILHARLTLPPSFDKAKEYPAILGSVYSNTVHNQWGGRVAHPTWGLDQYLAQQGYVLLNVDISGSSGYGKVFRQRIGMDYGGVDVEDLFSGALYLKSLGYVDPERIGMWGSSYGGLLTTMSLFTHPGVYKAGVAGAPATSLFHALTGEMRTMMAPQDHQEQYAKSSSFLRSGGLQDHLLLIHGMRDQVVLFKDSVTLLQRLISEEKNAELLVLPDAPHSWDTGPMAQTRYAYRHLVDYFRRYLGEGPSASRQAGTPSR